MRTPKSDSSVLNEAYAVSFILLLLEKKEALATEMREIISNYNTIVKLARRLEAAGLIEIEITSSPRVMHTYRLTEKGKKVAEKLKETADIVQK